MRLLSRMFARFRTVVTTRRRKLPLSERRLCRPRLEMLEDRLTPHANPVLSAEHLAVFGSFDHHTQQVVGGLAPDATIEYRSFASGKWTENVWEHQVNGVFLQDGTRPGEGDDVVISTGTVVTIDSDLSKDANGQRVALRTVRDDGTLRFDTHANTSLLVDTLLVTGHGVFEMGTELDPIADGYRAKVIFADRTKGLDAAAQAAFETERLAWDPLQFGLGLVSHGEISIHGSQKTGFVLGTKAIAANTKTIDLGFTVPTDWQVGDRLIVTGMTPTNAAGTNQDEEVAIAGINGNLITLATTLKYMHTGGAMYVANVTRNATFESETVDVVAHRGHIMFMHSDEVHVSAAGFYGLGRTDKRRPIDDPVNVPDLDNPGKMTTDVLLTTINSANPEIGHRVLTPVVDAAGKQVIDPATGKVELEIARSGLNARGRYAVHFHRTGLTDEDHPATIDGSAVVDSPGWGIVNHSSNVDITNNVVFNAVGAAFVTEAGDEIGTFDHNIAIHSLGSGEQIESRRDIQDFGHDGSGFWLQGGNVSLTNNVAAGQRHAGFVFFPRGLVQKGLGQATIAGENLSQYAWADPTRQYEVADVPLKEFKGNIAFAAQTGFESWFTLLHVSHQDRSVIEDLKVFLTTGDAVFTPYTNLMTFKNVTLKNGSANPTNTGFARNDVTQNILYDHVNVQGYAIGISAPVDGSNTIVGGTFNNLKNIYVTTTNAVTRVLNINDGGPTDPIKFLNNMKVLVNGVMKPTKQYDIYLESNFNPLHNDLTRIFSKDIIKLGTVTHNGQQVYYNEQAADYVPFPSTTWLAQHPGSTNHGPLAASFVPAALRDLTNAQLFAMYGLAVGGVVAPANALPDPLINGIVGAAAKYVPDAGLWSAKWYNDQNGAKPYYLIYSYFDPTRNQGKGGHVYIDEKQPRDANGNYILDANGKPASIVTPLVSGWNVITRYFDYADGSKLHQPVSVLVYNDNIPPTIVFDGKTPTLLNLADLQNGSTLFLRANIVDASFGSMHMDMPIKLNDSKYVSPLKTRADGSQFVTITFSITDLAGNVSIVKVDMTVTLTAPLIKDFGQLKLPYIAPSVTLTALIGHS